MLRNVGRSSVSPGHYVFVVDVDMMCNGDLYQSFLQLAQQLNLSVNKKGDTIVKKYLLNSRILFPKLRQDTSKGEKILTDLLPLLSII